VNALNNTHTNTCWIHDVHTS